MPTGRIDRDRVFRLKQEALRAIWAGFRGRSGLRRFRREQGAVAAAVRRRICALAERFGDDWRHGRPSIGGPTAAAVRRIRRASRPARCAYHQWLQWLLDEQLARAARPLPIVQDLPIGIRPRRGGRLGMAGPAGRGHFDRGPARRVQRRGPGLAVAAVCAVEAPRGRLRAVRPDDPGHAAPRRRPADRPRDGPVPPVVDPRGAAAPARAATSATRPTTCWQSWPWRAIGPGPWWSARTWARSSRASASGWRSGGILSCRLLWFEARPPAEYPRLSMAAVTTHDLPTIAGLWSGADLAAQAAVGLPLNEEMHKLASGTSAALLGLAADTPLDDVIEAAYGRLAGAPSLLLAATLEDAQAVGRAAEHARHERPMAQLVAGPARDFGADGKGPFAATHRPGPGSTSPPGPRVSKRLSQEGMSAGPLSLRERARVRAASGQPVVSFDAAPSALTPDPSPKGRGDLLR